jgi:hypothetical protein
MASPDVGKQPGKLGSANMRHLSVTALVLCLGALSTWVMASVLEQYALDHKQVAQARSPVPNLAAEKSSDQRWMF